MRDGEEPWEHNNMKFDLLFLPSSLVVLLLVFLWFLLQLKRVSWSHTHWTASKYRESTPFTLRLSTLQHGYSMEAQSLIHDESWYPKHNVQEYMGDHEIPQWSLCTSIKRIQILNRYWYLGMGYHHYTCGHEDKSILCWRCHFKLATNILLSFLRYVMQFHYICRSNFNRLSIKMYLRIEHDGEHLPIS